MEQKIKELLDGNNEVVESFFQSDYDPDSNYAEDYQKEFDAVVNKEGIKVEFCENHGGEDQGSDYWSIYKFSKGSEEVFVKFCGWYQSYNGSEFDEFKFVKPVQRMVTFYE